MIRVRAEVGKNLKNAAENKFLLTLQSKDFYTMLDNIKKIMVMLPTYNESLNIKPLIEELLKLDNRMEVVVVDDNSPDGTWRIVSEIQKINPKVHLVHRTSEKGRGSAGIVGFLYAVKADADLIIEMDADFSHNPKYIIDFLKEIDNYDVVVGSRLVKGGGETGRTLIRYIITLLANLYIKIILGLPIKDCTSGYKIFKRHVLEQIGLEKMSSKGPAIVQEVLYTCHKNNFKIKEVPIIFEERRAGKSSFNIKILLNSLISVLKFRFRGTST